MCLALTRPHVQDWPVAVMILGNTSLEIDAVTGMPYHVPATGIIILSGPYNHVPETAKTVVLDLNGSTTPMWDVAAAKDYNRTGLLIIQKLVRAVFDMFPLDFVAVYILKGSSH